MTLLLGLNACGGGSGGGSQSPDPVVVDMPIAYVKRPLPIDPDDATALLPDDILEPDAFNPGAALFVRDRAAPGAEERNITARAWPEGSLYDVKDLEVSTDGEKLLFAMRGPEDPDLDDDEQPKWDIWEYELDTDTLRRIIVSDTVAQQNDDVAPHYLPDGRIVFSSDRQQRTRSVLLNDGKPQYAGLHEGNLNNGDDPAFVLHTMDDDGSDLDQITFNQSHDLQPAVMEDGRLIFLRWDRWGNNNLSLYTANPDGSGVQIHYGFHSQNTGTNDTPAVFSQPREMPDGRILALLRPRESNRFGGDMVLIDAANYIDINQPTFDNNGASGPGQISASLLDVNIDGTTSPHGHFSAVYPFFDETDRLLVGWSQCQLVDPANPENTLACTDENLANPDLQEADPAYGLWIYNPVDGTQLPVVKAEQGIIYSDVVAMEPRTAPTHIQPVALTAEQSLMDEGVGVVHVRSVYDLDGTDTAPNGLATMRDPGQTRWDQRPARFLRIIKAVSIPDRDLQDFDTGAFGVSGAGQSMREILGYVPIEPDGSVKFKVPADLAFTISIVDAQGKRLPGFQRHQNWLQLRAGEQLECNGCHQRGSELPHGRQAAQAPSINSGAATSAPFPNTSLNAEIGETMAEAYARLRGIRTPTVDLRFTDEWSESPDPTDDITINYADLDAIGLPMPVLASCAATWTGNCRVTINYLDHIQPVWDLPRLDAANNNITCTSCHTNTDGNNAMVPAGQLELTNTTPSVLNTHPGANNLWNLSYRELFLRDAQVELNGANLQQRVIIDQAEVVDPDTGEVITPELSHVPECQPSMAASGARNSSSPRVSNTDCEALSSGRDFFSWFGPGAPHENYLTPAELKLISEWLDVGAQYYNNPFDAPVD